MAKDRFAGSLKPMCMGCMRRAYGMAKGDGWWCTNCDGWIVKPRRKRKRRSPATLTHKNVMGPKGTAPIKYNHDCIDCRRNKREQLRRKRRLVAALDRSQEASSK